MSELGRPFGLSFEDKEESAVAPTPAAAPAPQIGQPFGLSLGDTGQNGEIVEASVDAASEPSPGPSPAPPTPSEAVAAEVAPSAGAAAAQAVAAVEDDRQRDEAERRRISELMYQLSIDEAVIAAGRLARDDVYGDIVYRTAKARGVPVQSVDPEFTGRRDWREVREEEIRRRERQRQAGLEAERRKLSDAIGDTETGIYVGPNEEGKKFLKQVSDDERFRRLRYDEMAANEVEKWWRQRESASAIRHLRAVERFKQKEAEVRQKIANNEALSPDEESIRAGMHLSEQIMARETRRALGDLAAAQARLAQLPDSPALRKLKEADTVGGIITVLVNHPFEILAVKAGQAVPKTIASTAGTLLLGPYGGVLASAYVAFGSEYAGAVLQGFKDEGIDLENESAVQEAIKNKEKIERIYNKALVVAGIATMADIASGAVGNMRVTPIQSKIVEKGAQAVVQADIAIAAKKATDKALGKEGSKGERSDAGLDGALGALMPDVERLSF